MNALPVADLRVDPSDIQSSVAAVPVPASRLEYIPALDGIRGIAITMVMAYHFVFFEQLIGKKLDAQLGEVGHVVRGLVLGGWAGVDVFFVLSGFLITGILQQTKGRSGFFSVFYGRRFLRIFPAYYLWVGVFSVVLLHWFPSALRRADPHYLLWLFGYGTNVLITVSGWNAIPLALEHCWSLAVEEQFYLVWPLLIFALDRRRAIAACGFLMMMAPALRAILLSTDNARAATVLMPTRVDGLAAGALLALVFGGTSKRGAFFDAVKWTAFGAVIFLAALGALSAGGPLLTALRASALAFASAGVIVFATLPPGDSLVARWLASPVLRFLGKYSYGLYVVHQPVVYLLWVSGLMTAGRDEATHWVSPVLAVVGINLVIPFAVSVGVALLSWYALERSVLRMKDLIPYR